jgi:hypothetical protein
MGSEEPVKLGAVVHAASRGRLLILDSAGIEEDQPSERHEQAMLAVGVNERQIALRRMADVSQDAEGRIAVGAWRPVPRRGWEPIPDGVRSLTADDDATVGEAVRRALTWDYLAGPLSG